MNNNDNINNIVGDYKFGFTTEVENVIDTGKAFVMKRFHARGRGRGTRILKPFSNIRIILTEIEA